MAKKKADETMTGEQLQRIRRELFDMAQPEFAALMGVNFRTIVRLEACTSVPLYHARHVRCIMRERGLKEI